MKINLILMLVILLAPVTTFADNCDNPRDDFDGLYCLNKVYQEADKELNIEYKKLRTYLTKNQKIKLKRTQISWIKNRNKSCSFKKSSGFYVNLKCTANTTIYRTNILRDRIRECKATGCQESKL